MTDWWGFEVGGPIVDWPCCYVILSDGVAIYVGQTMNLKKRLRQHQIRPSYGLAGDAHTPWGPLPNVTIKANFGRKFGDWAMRELRLIYRLKPRFNAAGLGRYG